MSQNRHSRFERQNDDDDNRERIRAQNAAWYKVRYQIDEERLRRNERARIL